MGSQSGCSRRRLAVRVAIMLLCSAMAGGGLAGASAAAGGSEAVTAGANGGATQVVIAAHPLAHALVQRLLDGTGITVERVVPESLPPSRFAAYLGGRGAAALAEVAERADAVVGLRAMWPEDPIYPQARRSNIRIVEIDAARPVDGSLPGVALHADPAGAPYAWLDPSNLGRMADIVANDLGRLAPEHAELVAGRLAAFKREVLGLVAQAGLGLAALDQVTVFSLSDRLDYFIAGFNLELAGRDVRDDAAWTVEAAQALAASLREGGVVTVLHHREPAAALADALAQAQLRVVVLATEGQDPLGELETNVTAVIAGLN
ncbi:MAG: metal ABC transporter solute-binding protein, Zn/Mn family [Rhodocyclaceae bacterium]